MKKGTKRHQRKPAQRKALPSLSVLPDDAFARRAQIIPNPLPISAPTLWRWIKAGKFPAPKIIGGCPMWRVGVVREFLERGDK